MAVIDNKEESRYELEVDGHVAFAEYRLEGDTLHINYVFSPPELRGKGVAATLMEGVVADANKRTLHINPVCSYAATYMARHRL